MQKESTKHNIRASVAVTDVRRKLTYSWYHYTNDTQDAFDSLGACIAQVQTMVNESPMWDADEATEQDFVRIIKNGRDSGCTYSRLQACLGTFDNFDAMLQQLLDSGLVVLRNTSKHKGRQKLRYFVADTEDTPHGE